MNQEKRGNWYLLTGLVIGVILGLVYAWVIQPVKYVDTPPASLRQDFKDRYRALIAAAYAANGDLLRAQARLALLRDEDAYRKLSEQAQRTLAENGSADEARALGLLAVALGQAPPTPAATFPLAQETEVTESAPPTGAFLAPLTETFSPTPSFTLTPEPPPASPTLSTMPLTLAVTNLANPSPTETFKPRPSTTPAPSRTPTSTPGGPFVFLSGEKICQSKLSAPLFQIEALDRFGQPVPGVLVIVTWKDGEERFFTGLKPEIGPGYADFTPTPGIVYSLRLGEGGEVVTNQTALECKGAGGASYWGAWLLKFIQP